jgi:AraC-like DNA-binding protein
MKGSKFMSKPFPAFHKARDDRIPCFGRRFQDLIEANPRTGLPIGYYAAVLGVSESRLYSHCHRFAGQSPLRMVNACVMHRAAELLSKETLSVKAIALCLGFHDPGYFSRFFRQRTGRTPSAFRAAARAVNARMVGHAYCSPTGQENHRLEFSVVINPDPINAPRVRADIPTLSCLA